MAEPFTFGIALIARAFSGDWDMVEALLDLTLVSILGQSDGDFQIVVAGHDRPRTGLDGDPRLTFLQADWPADHPGRHNADSGRKHRLIAEHVLGRGGGLLMFVDADDWVDRRLVALARRLGPEADAAVIEAGFATDLRSLRSCPLPHPAVFDEAFHRLCGSSGLIRLRPEVEGLRRNPYPGLQPHNLWIENAALNGLAVATLPAIASYVINTSQNHSETHGPYADWRRHVVRAVNRVGLPLSAGMAARFGLDPGRIGAMSRQLLAA